MKPSKKASIVIPVFNQRSCIENCLDAVLGQSLHDIEVICIDDGSTDGSNEILVSYAMRDSRLRVLSQLNQGAGAARNAGIEAAQGKYVIFCDPDDEYPDEFVLEKLYRAAEDNNALVSGGSFSIFHEDTGEVQTRFDGILSGYTFDKPGFVPYEDYQFDYGFMRFLFNRQMLMDEGIRFPGYRRYQDPPFLVRALHAAGGFYAIPDVVYRYRLGHQGNFWTTEKKLALLDGLEDVLGFAARNGLPQLYSLTIMRIETEYRVLLGKQVGDDAVFVRLLQVNAGLQPGLLSEEQRESAQVGEGLYLLAPLRDDVEALRQWERVDGSRALALSEAIAYLPRKLRGSR